MLISLLLLIHAEKLIEIPRMGGDAVVQTAAESVAQLITMISSSARITLGSNNNVMVV